MDLIRTKWLVSCLSLLSCAVASGEIAVHDDWVQAGRVTLEGDAWGARVDKGGDALVVSSRGQFMRVRPFAAGEAGAGELAACEVVSTDSAAEAEVRAVFAAGGNETAARFRFTSYGTLRVTPGAGMEGVYIECPMQVGVLPGRQLEDALYRPEEYPGLERLHVPSENWFLGLVRGNGAMVACAWPEGGQTVALLLEDEGSARLAKTIAIAMDGKDLYLELIAAPGIWHKEKLELASLEKDATLDWKRPFNATYKTQLLMRAESDARRTFHSRDGQGRQWRPEIGSFKMPLWFDGDRALMHLGKRIPPRGSAIIYPMDDGGSTLMGFLRRTPIAEMIAERNKERGLPEGPGHATNVGFNACWGTYLLRHTVYAFGVQEREKEFLSEHIGYLSDRVAMTQIRNATYTAFIDRMEDTLGVWLEAEKRPNARAYLERMAQHLDRVGEGHRQQMDMYGYNTPEAHVAHAGRNAARLKELFETPGPEAFPECYDLVDEFNRLSWGHSEDTGMRFSMLTRPWAQDAAAGCADNPEVLEYARAIRAGLRDALNGAAGW